MREAHISAIMVFIISHMSFLPTLIMFCCLCLESVTGAAIDTITSSQYIKEPETLSSKSGLFTLGFLSTDNSANRYVGIWYMSESAVTWVANRNQPLRDSSGSFTISEDGKLVVLDGQKLVIWSSSVSNIISPNSSCQLSDFGNLVLLDSSGKKVWESFQHPTDTFLPNMKITNNKITGEKVQITSWKSPSDPSIGNFSASLERLPSIAEAFTWDETHPYWRSGPWNGQVFTGIPEMNSSYLNGFRMGDEGDDTFSLTYSFANASFLAIFVLTWQGELQEKYWVNEKKEWRIKWKAQASECDVYGICGAFGSYSLESSSICSCLRGFEQRNREEWNRQNWTNGCVRRTALQCERTNTQNGTIKSKGDGFRKLQRIKVPPFANWSWTISEDACRSRCLENCACIAYSYDAGIRCMSWSGNLIDIRQFSRGGNDLYIRLADSELGDKEGDATPATIIVAVTVGMVIIVTCAYFLWKYLGLFALSTFEIFPCLYLLVN